GVDIEERVGPHRGTVAEEHARDLPAGLGANQVAGRLANLVVAEPAEVWVVLPNPVPEAEPAVRDLEVRVGALGRRVVPVAVTAHEQGGDPGRNFYPGPPPQPPVHGLDGLRPELVLAVHAGLVADAADPTVGFGAGAADLALVRVLPAEE